MSKLTHGPIIGATTHNSVVIWLRADSECTAKVLLAQSPDDLTANIIKKCETQLHAETDFTGTVRFEGLQTDKTYAYTVLLDETAVLPTDQYPIPQFKTFPASGSNLSFAFGSCFIPQDYGDEIFARINEQIMTTADANLDLRFFVMLGDNVYVDHYYEQNYADQNNEPDLLTLYRETYHESWKYENFRRALMNIPTFMIFDDHEFWNNWGNIPGFPHEEGPYDMAHFEASVRSYWEYQDQHNPETTQRHASEDTTNVKAPYYYTFSAGDIGFFVLDCRTRRIPGKTMLGQEQLDALKQWLLTNKDSYRVKFIISSVPVAFIALPRWLVNKVHGTLGDQWLGYPQERAEIFKFIQDYDIQNIHFLSGDIHLGQGVVIQSKLNPAHPTVYSYTASPLAQSTSLLSVQAPAWSSALVGALVGLGVGTALSRLTGVLGILLSLVIGAGAGELIRRLTNQWQHTDPNQPAFFGRLLYKFFRGLVQGIYRLGIRKVAGDEIKGDGVHYQPDNLFSHTEVLHFGVVNVQQTGEDVTVQFTIYDENGRIKRQEKTPHKV